MWLENACSSDREDGGSEAVLKRLKRTVRVGSCRVMGGVIHTF